VLYAATYYDDVGVLKSYDGGASWTEISHGYASDVSFDIDVLDGDPDRLLAATESGVQTSIDGGKSWQAAEGLNGGIVLSLCHFPGSDDVFAGSYQNGVYLAARGGHFWSAINSGLRDQSVHALKVVGASPVRVFAGTNGMGSWEYNLTLRPATHGLYLFPISRSLSGPFPATDLYEPNDASPQSYTLPGPGTYYAYMWPTGDLDWYHFNVSSLGPVSIDLDNIPVDSDFDLYLFNNSGVSVDRSTQTGNRAEHIVFQPATTGIFYIAVVDWLEGSSTQPYRLTVSFGGTVGAGQIYGTTWSDSLPASFVPVQLCSSNGYRDTCISTTTDSSGVYRFRGMPTLPVGHEYFVNYPNHEASSDRLLAFQCRPVENYQAGQSTETYTFDLADVTAVSSPSGSTQSLPTTFTWNKRNLANDGYVLRLQDLMTGRQWTSPALGNASNYVLTGLPMGFSTGQEYGWDVLVYTDQGTGLSLLLQHDHFLGNRRQQRGRRQAGPQPAGRRQGACATGFRSLVRRFVRRPYLNHLPFQPDLVAADVLGRQLERKARGGARDRVPSVTRGGQVELALSARQANIEHPPFLAQLALILQGRPQREVFLFHADQDHHGELGALRVVQRHQADLVALTRSLGSVGPSHQRLVIEEGGQ